MKFLSALAASAVAFLFISPSHALSTQECSDAHFQAQVARSEGRLLDAEEQLSMCGDATCPGVLVAECGPWLKEVTAAIPSIVIVAEDMRGQDVVDVTLIIDDAPYELGQSSSVRLDPGKHEIVVNAEGHLPRREVIRLRETERYRRVRVFLEKDESQVVEDAPRVAIWPLALTGGLALAGGAAFAVLGLDARASENDLRDCRPECSDNAVGAVRLKYILANGALGVGVAALLGGGIYFTIAKSRSRDERSSLDVERTAPEPHPAWSLKLNATQPGLQLSGAF